LLWAVSPWSAKSRGGNGRAEGRLAKHAKAI
jgi:hypothetical protein